MRIRRLISFTLVVTSCLASQLCAQPFGYSINSDSTSRVEEAIDVLYELDLANGNARPIGPVGFLDVEALGFGPDGILYGVDDESNTLIQIDTETGRGSRVSDSTGNLGLLPTVSYDFGMVYSCDAAAFLVSSDNQNNLYRVPIDPFDGATLIGSTGEAAITGMTRLITTEGEQIFGISDGSIAKALYRIDPNTAATTLVGMLNIPDEYADAGLTFDNTGQMWAILDRTSITTDTVSTKIYRINHETAEATFVSDTFSGYESLAINYQKCDGTLASVGTETDGIPDVPTLNFTGLLILFIAFVLISSLFIRRKNH